MKTLWLNWHGTEEARKKTELERLPYPLCYNLPPTAWDVNLKEIRLLEQCQKPELYLDLLVEVGADISSSDKKRGESAVAGYRLCIGVADSWFDREATLPTVRDKGVCLYYSRMPDNYNAVSPLLDIEWKDLGKVPLELDIGGKKYCVSLDFFQNPDEVLSFMTGFLSLNKGDMVSLGSFVAGMELGKTPLEVSIAREKFSLDVKIVSS